MGLKIISKEYTQLVHSGDPQSFLIGNAPQRLSETITIEFDFDFTSSTDIPVIIADEYSLQILSGSWEGLGFVVGDTVELTGEASNADGNTLTFSSASFVIQSIDDDVMTFTAQLFNSLLPNSNFAGILMPSQGQGTPLEIVNTSRSAPEELEVYHNLQPNSASQSNQSIIDGEVNRFVVEGVDTLAVSGSLTPEQIGFKSGGAYVDSLLNLTRITDVSGKRRFELTLAYFLPDLSDANFDRATWFDANECLKTTYLINGYPELNNPNSKISLSFDSTLGNTGEYDEEHNQGVNPFTLESVVITNPNGDVLSTLDHNQTCIVTAQVSHPSLNFNSGVEVRFQVVPPVDEWQNNEYSFGQNVYLSHFFKPGASPVVKTSYTKEGRNVDTDNHSVDVSVANNITVQFDFVPNSDFTQYIESLPEEQRLYRIALSVESAGGDGNNNDNVGLTLLESTFEAEPIPDQPYDDVTFTGFYNHKQDIETGTSETSYNGCTEDDFVYKALFNLSKSIVWETITAKIEVVRTSDGISFDLDSKTIPLSQFVTSPDGTQNINYSESLNQFLNNDGRNVFTIANTGVDGGTDYEVKLVWSILANWRYWIANNQAFADFFDISLPNDGRSQEWMRYLRESGYEIRLRVRLIRDDVAYYFGGNINLQDYESNLDAPTVNTDITFIDEDGVTRTVLLENQEMIVRADHTLLSGSWPTSDTWGWISRRPNEADPNKRISTVWDWSSLSLPLKPKSGLSKAELTFPSTNVARIECKVDTSLINVDETTFISRIETPSEPACKSAIQWFFDYIVDNADGEDDYLATMQNALGKGLGVGDSNVCCPTCSMRKTADGQNYYIYAFGKEADITTYLGTFDTSECCRDTYKVTAGCDADFDAEIVAFGVLIGDTDIVVDYTASQINTYTNNDIEAITDGIVAMTTSNAVRSLLMRELLENGFKIECNIADGSKFISRL